MQVWLPGLLAPLLCAACSFDSPKASPDGSGSGSDQLPLCPDGDSDNDGVCNAADKCPDKPDGGDGDGDGVVDGCDDWLCGATKPNDPGPAMNDSGSGGREWGASFIDIGMARRVNVAPGAQFRAKFAWGFRVDCGGGPGMGGPCRAQLEIGYDLTRVGCIYDNNVGDDDVRIGGFDDQLTAPTTPGIYEIRLNAGRSTSCGTAEAWYSGEPGSDSAIAYLCVR
jgi:hypothetical protein